MTPAQLPWLAAPVKPELRAAAPHGGLHSAAAVARVPTRVTTDSVSSRADLPGSQLRSPRALPSSHSEPLPILDGFFLKREEFIAGGGPGKGTSNRENELRTATCAGASREAKHVTVWNSYKEEGGGKKGKLPAAFQVSDGTSRAPPAWPGRARPGQAGEDARATRDADGGGRGILVRREEATVWSVF